MKNWEKSFLTYNRLGGENKKIQKGEINMEKGYEDYVELADFNLTPKEYDNGKEEAIRIKRGLGYAILALASAIHESKKKK